VITYIAGVHLLKRWMRHRKAFELQPLLIIWNTALAVFSATGAWRFGEEFAFVMRNRTFQVGSGQLGEGQFELCSH